MELHFRSARSAVLAGELMLDIIHRYKYPTRAVVRTVSGRPAGPPGGPGTGAGRKWDMIVPVPLHPTRRREREFNQAERLGRASQPGHGNSDEHQPAGTGSNLHRPRRSFGRKERAANMRNAFALRPGVELEGSRVVVLDDVCYDWRYHQRLCQSIVVRRRGGRVRVGGLPADFEELNENLSTGHNNGRGGGQGGLPPPAFNIPPHKNGGHPSHFLMSTTQFSKKTLGLETVEPAVTPSLGKPETNFVKITQARRREIQEKGNSRGPLDQVQAVQHDGL